MPDIKVTDENSIKIPERSDMFGVEKKEWNRIKRLISELSLKSTFWENFGWFFSATTISFFISYFSVEDSNNFKQVFLTGGIFSLIITGILFFVNYSLSENTKKQKQGILDEMKSMEISDNEVVSR